MDQTRQSAPKGASRRGRRTDTDVLERLHEALLLYPDSPASVIYRHLQGQEDIAKRLPGERAIRNLVHQSRQQDAARSDATEQSPPWSLLSDETGHEAALIYPVLREAMARTGRAYVRLTKRRASLIARLRRAAPALHPWQVYTFAARYEELSEEDASRLDARMAVFGLAVERGVTHRFTHGGGFEVLRDDEEGES